MFENAIFTPKRAPRARLHRYQCVLAAVLALPGLAWAQTQVPARLKINELSIGAPEYVELHNAGSRPVDLSAMRFVTSQGTFVLAGAGRLAPGDYFVVARGFAGMEAMSNNPAVRMQIVARPMLGVLADTVVVEDENGRILDAVSYGSTADTSSRYAAAVVAGQFATGQFVDVSQSFGTIAIGRDANGTDTNNLAADWRLHGGADAYAGSPFDANTAIIGGEDTAIQIVQERVNQILLNVYRSSVTTAAAVNYSGTDAVSSAEHTFTIDSPELGTLTLAGRIQYAFTGAAGGDHSIRYHGTLGEATGDRRFLVDVTETVVGNTRTLSLATDLFETVSGTRRPYAERLTLTEVGARGGHTGTQTRAATDWFGISRTSSGTCQYRLNVNGGALDHVAMTMDVTRDFPAAPNLLWNGPNPPHTREVLHLEGTARESATGMEVRFPVYRASYGGFGSLTAADTEWVARVDAQGDTMHVERYEPTTFSGPSGSTTTRFRVSGDCTAVPGTDHAAIASQVFHDLTLVDDFQAFIDPPTAESGSSTLDIDWDKWKRRLWKAAKKAAQVTGIFVVGGWCAVSTFAMGAVAVAGIATVWVAVVGVLGVFICGGICAVLLWLLS